MALAFESKVQNLIFQMDQGAGRKVIHAVLFVLFACAIAALFTFTNFQGLLDEDAFDSAQVARNYVEQGELLTRCVRPLSIWLVAAHSPTGDAAVMHHPDLAHPPLWPLILAGVYRVMSVSMQTRQTAALYGLHDRGVIAPGMKADLNVIDFDALAIQAPEMIFDLPAEGRRLIQKASGYRATVVSGVVTFEDGEATGELPGKLIRGPQAAPAALAAE